jgi:hypothetical protein
MQLNFDLFVLAAMLAIMSVVATYLLGKGD